MASKILKSTIWSIVQRYCPSIIQIIATLIITRFILPSDYGEVALVTTFLQICTLLVSSGLGEGLMFKSSCSDKLYNSVFLFNIGVASFLYLCLFIFSESIAEFYEIQRLSTLIKVVSLNLIVYSLSYSQRVIFQKDLNFKFLAISSFISTILGSIIGIAMALQGCGVWSIIVLTLSLNIIDTLLIWIKSTWKPRFIFDWKGLKEILCYSFRILSNNIVQVIYDNIYSLVLGKFFGSRNLGLYNRMQTVVYFTTTNFLYSLESAFFPILCKDKNNETYLNTSYEKLLRLSVMLSSFVLVLTISVAKEVIYIILTDKWLDGVDVLVLLSIAFLFVPISYINNSFLKIWNKTKCLLYGNVFKKICGITILIGTIMTNDFKKVCIGVIFYYLIDSMVSMIITHKYLGIRILNQVRYILNSFVLILIVYCLMMNVSFCDNIYLCLFEKLLIISVIYILYNTLLKTKEYCILKSLICKN